jgi:hypothetical protein
MAKLTELSLLSMDRERAKHPASFEPDDHQADNPEGDSDGPPSSEVSEQQRQQQIIKVVQDLFRRDLASWEADDYVLNGTVQVEGTEDTSRAMILVEDPTKRGGQRFDYHAARIKVDTGSAADFATLEYLTRVGFNMASLNVIPEAEQVEIEGLNKAIYKPKYRANLQWYRQGEAQTNVTPFFVVDHGPFDLLLSSRRFAEEAERRLFSLPLVRPRKTRGEHWVPYS